MSKDNKDYEREVAFFQKVDRIISGDTRVKVINETYARNIAYINMRTKEIFLAFNQIEGLTKNQQAQVEEIQESLVNNKTRFIALCKGFNYHEVAHNEFTRFSLENLQSLNSYERNTLAMIDDGRIESLWGTAYPRTTKYFLNCFCTMIHSQKNRQPQPELWLLAESRKLFLPKKIIYFYQSLFEEKYTAEVTKKIKALIDEFLGSDDIPRQLAIAKEITELMSQKNNRSSDVMYDMKVNQSQHRTGKGGYKERQKQEIEDLKEALKQLAKELPELDEKEKELLKKMLEQQKKIDDAKKKSDEESRKNDEKWRELNRKDNERLRKKNEFTDEVDKRRKSSNPSQSTKKEQDLLKEIEQLTNEIKKTQQEFDEQTKKSNEKTKEWQKECEEMSKLNGELVEEVIDENADNSAEIDAETSKDVKTIYQEETTGNQAGIGESDTKIDDGRVFSPSSHHRLIAKKLARTINKIQNDTSRGRVPRQETGDINTDRAMNFKKTGDLKIFDKYAQDDRRATKIGVVILLDSSSSMAEHNFTPALESVWAINEAVNKTRNKTIIIEYSNDYKIIKNFKDRKGDFRRHFCHGTQPHPALLEAQKQIKIATKCEKIQNWIVYILTDGDWSRSGEAEKVIKELNDNKIVTHLIHFLPSDSGMDEERIPQHGCTHKTIIKGDIHKLEPLLRKTLTKIAFNIRTRLNKIKGV